MAPPTKFNKKMADRICTLIAEGWSLRNIAALEDMPAKSNMLEWIRTKPAFQDQYTRAKRAAIDMYADELLDIADDASNDWMIRQFGDREEEVFNSEHYKRSELRVKTRQWLMQVLKPKKYNQAYVSERAKKDLGTQETDNKLEITIVDAVTDKDTSLDKGSNSGSDE